MASSFFKKKKTHFLSCLILSSLACASHQTQAWASTSLMVNGHAGFVGEYSFSSPPGSVLYHGFRVPIGLTFIASPTDNLSLFLGLDYGYNAYPVPPVLLGQTSSTSQGNTNGTSTPMPFANATAGSPFSQKLDFPTLTQAYISYQSSMGLFRAGRMPRSWGLGLWLNDEWNPYGGAISTSDAISLGADFNLFDVTGYVEKYGESIGGTSNDGQANAFTVEARLKSDPTDPPSSGIAREVGVVFSRFGHSQSNTNLNILDGYQKFYIDSFYIGAEALYLTGNTQNPNYRSLGGAPACSTTVPSATPGSQTCSNQQVSAIEALLKLKYQFNSSQSTENSIAATEKAQRELGTSMRQATQTAGLWVGYASGGQNQFTQANSISSNNSITAIAMNPSIQPAFLMFNTTLPPVNGMPMGAVTNTTFVRGDYTYETPDFGAVEPVFTWAILNQTNANFNAQNSVCGNNPALDPTNPANVMCVGGNKNLGGELDVNYHYTTLDRVTLSLDAGWWFVGNAWQIYGQGTPPNSYGIRAAVYTVF